MLKIGQTSHTLFADESDVVIPWTALRARSQKCAPKLMFFNEEKIERLASFLK